MGFNVDEARKRWELTNEELGCKKIEDFIVTTRN